MSRKPITTLARYGRELASILRRARQLWQLTPRFQKGTLAAGMMLIMIGGLANTAIPLLLGRLVDSVSGKPSPGAVSEQHAQVALRTVLYFLTLIGGAYLLREAIQVARRFLVEYTCTHLEKHLLVRLVSHLLMADLSALSKEKIGTLHGRILRNIAGSVRFLRVSCLDFLPALVSGTFALTAVFVKGPWVGLLLVGVIPLSVLLTMRQLVSQKGVRIDLLRNRDELDGTVVEQLQGIDYIRAANTHKHETRRVARAAERLRARELQHQFVMSLYGSGKALIEGLFHVLVLGTAVYLAAIGRISVGDILMFSMLFLNVMAPLSEIHRMIDEGHESSLLVAELVKMLKEPIDRCYLTKTPHSPVLDGSDVIVVENLVVDYAPDEANRRRALDGVSLRIRPGEIIGIAGRSGCGKSTLLRVLLRLVHPSDGRAEVAGVPLDVLDRESMAKLLGYVGQSPFVFSSTIEENIAYERLGATLEEIRDAARRACIEDEILEFPGGFSATIAEHGQNLSGGQKQRLALARVFLKNPPVLILDEATSALDTINEGRIQQWLIAERGKRTVILVAHRLSTLLHADRIFVFDAGRIVEIGSYHELVNQGGFFTELVRSAGGSSPLQHDGPPVSQEWLPETCPAVPASAL